MKDSVIIDTNVIFSGLKSRNGISFKLLEQIPKGKFQVEISVPLILEYETILKKFSDLLSLDFQDIDNFLDYICLIGNKTRIYYLWRPILKDPFDDHILEVAVASNSKYIITYNIKDFAKAKDFNITAITPKDFLKLKEVI